MTSVGHEVRRRKPGGPHRLRSRPAWPASARYVGACPLFLCLLACPDVGTTPGSGDTAEAAGPGFETDSAETATTSLPASTTDALTPTTSGSSLTGSGSATTSTSQTGEPHACISGEHRCIGEILQTCAAGGWLDEQTCDPLMGLTCNPAGYCDGKCSWLGPSYIGCDYYAVSTLQMHSVFADTDFAVGAVNTGDTDAVVTITYDGDIIEQRTIGAGQGAAIVLPEISALISTGDTLVVQGGAYRIRATAPITAYQYNPLQEAYSNDASLLLPTNAWTGRYVLAAWHHWESFNHPGMFAVTAREDGTTVTISPAKGGTSTQAGAGLDAAGYGSVLLNAGDVLQVQSNKGGDFTGTQVVADRPVQVIAGHECTAVPSDSFACDHLEESILPFEALGREYAVVPPAQWPNVGDKAVFVRIVAAEDATTLEFAPEQMAPTFLAQVGDFVELGPTTEAFVVKADKKILVAEYMVSQEFGYGTSDPSMVLGIPREQYRAEYIVYAHPTWEANFADIVAPLGATVEVDGEPAPPFEPIGASGLGFAHLLLDNTGDGAHQVAADEPFGVSVYGVEIYSSYWYPGGLEVEAIPPG